MKKQLNLKRYKNVVFILILLIELSPFIFWIINHLFQDAWWDEIISLKDYALVDFKTTVTKYPDPNNHILFNLINNLFTRIFGLRNIYETLNYIYLLRCLQVFFACITILYSYIIVRNFFSKDHSFIVVGILASTIPFLNFSLQLRGYNLSMMFFVMLIYHVWNYLESKKKIDLLLFFLLTFLLIYTLPSNIYAFIAFAITILYRWNKERIINKKEMVLTIKTKNKTKIGDNKRYLLLFLFGLLALLAIYGAYTPIMDTLLNNRFVIKEPENRLFVLNAILPDVINNLLSRRWIIFFIILAGIWLKLKTKKNIPNESKLLELLFIFVMPFVFMFVHNKL